MSQDGWTEAAPTPETVATPSEPPKIPNFKVFVAIPSYDKKLYVNCVHGLLNATQVLIKNNIEFSFNFEVGMPWLTMARNNLAREFLASDCTELVFIDADIGFQPEAFRDLIVSNEAIIAGAYPKKQDEELFAVLVKLGEDGHPIVEHGAVEADGLPTGFMKIKRIVFEKIMSAHPELVYEDIITGKPTYNFFGMFIDRGKWYGDDYGFCKLWTDLGEKLWILPNMTLTHAGNKIYSGNLHNLMVSQFEKEQSDKAVAK